MNDEQKLLCRTLIEMSYEMGFSYYPLSMVAARAGLTADLSTLYDWNTETGALWPFDSRSGGKLAGMLFFHVSDNGDVSVAVSREDLGMLELWCEWK